MDYASIKELDAQLEECTCSPYLWPHFRVSLMTVKRTLPEDLMSNLDVEGLPINAGNHPHTVRSVPAYCFPYSNADQQVLQRFGIRLLVSQCRLHLNRLPFSRSLSLAPLAPHTSPFGQSFLTLLQSAEEIVNLVKQLVFYHPGLIARWWAFWFHAYTSAVCL